MTAKKDEKTFWLTTILLTVSELHVTFFITFKCPAYISITSQKMSLKNASSQVKKKPILGL